MHLIKDEIVRISTLAVSAFCESHGVRVEELHDTERLKRRFANELNDYSMAVDFAAAGTIANRTQTFLFNSEQVTAFVRAIDRKLPPGDYNMPFDFMAIQFDKGIDEKIFTAGLRSAGSVEEADEILGLLIAAPNEESGSRLMNVIAWYKSTSINRVLVPIDGNGEIEYNPLVEVDDQRIDIMQRDKQRIVNLALLCLAYMSSPRMTVEKVSEPEAVNRKRIARGKRVLEDYYIIRYNPPGSKESEGEYNANTGRHVSYRFDVGAFFRTLPNGRVIFIGSHQRGLVHEKYVPKVYKVD